MSDTIEGLTNKIGRAPSFHQRDQAALRQIMLSIKKFEEWIRKSRKGDKIMYYRGFLFAPNQQKLSPTLDFKRVGKLATHVRNAYHRDTLTMVQKKHDDFDYEYWAVRT